MSNNSAAQYTPATLGEIKADEPVAMTAGLQRLFAAAGCSPTNCHACSRRIKAGMVFRLVEHNGTDEMCCDRCGTPQLVKRDELREKATRTTGYVRVTYNHHGGYSRPSAKAIGEPQ